MSNSRVNAINERIYERYVPTMTPQVLIDNRPRSTKYDLFSSVNEKPPVKESFHRRELYNTNLHFIPGDSAPAATYLSNVNIESDLRNQFFALQKSDRSAYVPSSESDLYNVEVVGRNEKNIHPLLFKEYGKECSSRKIVKTLRDDTLFNNHTRNKINTN